MALAFSRESKSSGLQERYACTELVTGSLSASCLSLFIAFQSWRYSEAQEEEGEVRGAQQIA